MLAVYTLSSKKRNVLVDPNKYEYNLQSMSRDKSKSFWNCVEKRKHSKCVATAVVKESDNIIISLSNNHNHNINHAKCAASAIEKIGEIKNFTAWGNCCWGSCCWGN